MIGIGSRTGVVTTTSTPTIFKLHWVTLGSTNTRNGVISYLAALIVGASAA